MLSMVGILNRCAEACHDCELVLEEPFVQDLKWLTLVNVEKSAYRHVYIFNCIVYPVKLAR